MIPELTTKTNVDDNQCDDEVFRTGTVVLVTCIPKETANDIAKAFSAATKHRIDWHYVAGRVVFKVLPPKADLAPSTLVEGQTPYKTL